MTRRRGRVGQSHKAGASDLRVEAKHRPVETRPLTEDEWMHRKARNPLTDVAFTWDTTHEEDR